MSRIIKSPPTEWQITCSVCLVTIGYTCMDICWSFKEKCMPSIQCPACKTILPVPKYGENRVKA